MAQLERIVIADPSVAIANEISAQAKRLAKQHFLADNGQDTIALVNEHNPECLILSLELQHPEATEVAQTVSKAHSDLFIVATFRELAVSAMDKLDRFGIDDFLPQPIDYIQLFRAASARFGTGFRRHTRYKITLDIYRADGVLIAKTRDISEGGLLMDCLQPIHAEQSILMDIGLTDSDEKLRTRCAIIQVDGEPPQPVTARGQFENLRGEEFKRLTEYLLSLQVESQAP